MGFTLTRLSINDPAAKKHYRISRLKSNIQSASKVEYFKSLPDYSRIVKVCQSDNPFKSIIYVLDNNDFIEISTK